MSRIIPEQIRALDSYQNFNSNQINALTRSLTGGRDCILYPETNLEVTRATNNFLVSAGSCVVDDVLIEFTEDMSFNYTSSDNWDLGMPDLDSTAELNFVVAVKYAYIKCKPPVQAEVCFIDEANFVSNALPDGYLFIKRVNRTFNGTSYDFTLSNYAACNSSVSRLYSKYDKEDFTLPWSRVTDKPHSSNISIDVQTELDFPDNMARGMIRTNYSVPDSVPAPAVTKCLCVGSDGKYILADKRYTTKIPVSGLMTAYGILLNGVYRNSTAYSFVAGSTLYVGTDGSITDERTEIENETAQPVGIALSSDTIYFNPSFEPMEKIEHAYIPNGLILPFLDNRATPTRWIDFSSANNRFLLSSGVAGSLGTINLARVGGSQSLLVDCYSSYSGDHTGSGYPFSAFCAVAGGSAGLQDYATNDSAGYHRHVIYQTVTYRPPSLKVRLIKYSGANEDKKIPYNSGILTSSLLQGSEWTDHTLSYAGRLLEAASAFTTGDNYNIVSVTSQAGGSHIHSTVDGVFLVGITLPVSESSGSHSHTFSCDVTPFLQQYQSRLYANNSEVYLQPGMIAFWDGSLASIPYGWQLADFDGGSFLGIGNVTNFTKYASDSYYVNLSASANFTASHRHDLGVGGCASVGSQYGVYHTSYPWSHPHVIAKNLSYVPPYYGLHMIQKL